MEQLRREISARIPAMWFQPNEVNLSPFPTNPAQFQAIEELIAAQGEKLKNINIYRYTDAIDFVPKGIDKGVALRFLADELHIALENIAAVGDGVNDYPMFAVAGISIGVHIPDTAAAAVNVRTCTEAIQFLLEQSE